MIKVFIIFPLFIICVAVGGAASYTEQEGELIIVSKERHCKNAECVQRVVRNLTKVLEITTNFPSQCETVTQTVLLPLAKEACLGRVTFEIPSKGSQNDFKVSVFVRREDDDNPQLGQQRSLYAEKRGETLSIPFSISVCTNETAAQFVSCKSADDNEAKYNFSWKPQPKFFGTEYKPSESTVTHELYGIETTKAAAEQTTSQLVQHRASSVQSVHGAKSFVFILGILASLAVHLP